MSLLLVGEVDSTFSLHLIFGDADENSGFKFLPVLGKYLGLAWNNSLTPHLKNKWRFRTEYEHREDAFWGDGSRGGPERRELDSREKAKL